MKHLDEYRDPQLSANLVAKIKDIASQRWTLMEVCGGQTHGLLRHGIVEALDDVVEMLHGPGCPVCVTPVAAIEMALAVARHPQTVLASFGDMLRVPGVTGSLLKAKSQGADVRIVYSPLDAVEIARRSAELHVVFFAVGFETTVPSTALAVLQAQRLGLENFSVLTAHVRVLPAMQAIALAPDCRVQGFLAAGHVCTVMGYNVYREFSQTYRLPVVVTGFEPVDLLSGIYECIRQLECGQFEVANAYVRSVRPHGNFHAQTIINRVFEIADRPWRGLGLISHGGLVLRPEFAKYDATCRYPNTEQASIEPLTCLSGEVMTGRIRPPQCPHFGLSCTPQNPLGAPMVSSEGACAAYFAYQRRECSSSTGGPT